MFIDTHCHLDAEEFGDEQAALVKAAHDAGVGRMVVPSVARANFGIVRDLCKQHPGCSPAYGIHPMYTDGALPQDLTELREYLALPDTVAVGEIGLDFFIDHYDRARQEFFFVEQLKLAQEFDLPVLLHIRRAQDIVLKHLRQTKVRGGIAHAFNGSRQQADEFIKLGFKLGFGGAMTYSRATRLRELAATLPLDSIVLETDAPDIPPDFLERGLPNEPQYVPHIAQTLVELRGLPLEEIARITTENVLSALPKLGSAN
ncbi:TatD related DNase [Ferrigenium kumadai]|uniref:TatD related DNase n=1 Tax=Ferrigenium kumadai TaxID=1682490 RepID=A0AAN1T1C4_9PROT|nr:TatD family hydrolase [Ferrigenium kumadai]BBJ00407.1 TatD related DNase [Ferrigenium kumadai]